MNAENSSTKENAYHDEEKNEEKYPLSLHHPQPISDMKGYTFTALEAALRQTIAPEIGYVSRAPSDDEIIGEKKSQKYPLSWEEAKKIDVVAEIEEEYGSDTSSRLSNVVRTQLPKSFRWRVRMTPEKNGIQFLAIEGDVSSVYPGLTAEIFANDPTILGKYFSTKAINEMSMFVGRAMAGVDMSGEVVNWHSLPEYDFIIQLEIHQSITFKNAQNKLVVIQSGETRIATEYMRSYAQCITNIVAEHRETVDHRFGNKIRLMHLLCQEGRTSELDSHFQRLRFEIDIRRNLFENLPPITPISPLEFIRSEFPSSFDITIDKFRDDTDLLFYSLSSDTQNSPANHKELNRFTPEFKGNNNNIKKGKPISPIILQVLILQDLASNALKHGTGKIHFQILPNYFIVSNQIRRDKKNAEISRHVGLGALKAISRRLGLKIDFIKSESEFKVCLFINIEFIHSEKIASPERSSFSNQAQDCYDNTNADNEQEKNRHKKNKMKILAHKAQALHWVLIDDDELICTKFHVLAKRKFGIDVHKIHTPSDVANIVKIIFSLTRNDDPRPLVVIFDENLLELDDDLNLVAITGTEIRDRLLSKPRIKLLVKTGRLFFFSASASIVADQRVCLQLGKSATVTHDIERIIHFLEKSIIFPSFDSCSSTLFSPKKEHVDEKLSSSCKNDFDDTTMSSPKQDPHLIDPFTLERSPMLPQISGYSSSQYSLDAAATIKDGSFS
mmetsp:Transcript_3965/g.5573  ORF Transcript_3965/g.5573 Transcript_3965/m.5573 type:complete len:728 (-) Transcript_3965:183-2366(-)